MPQKKAQCDIVQLDRSIEGGQIPIWRSVLFVKQF